MTFCKQLNVSVSAPLTLRVLICCVDFRITGGLIALHEPLLASKMRFGALTTI